MWTVFIDADACPVKDEVYRVARRYGLAVKVVANAPLRVPADAQVELVVCRGFGAADDWIAEHAGPGDIIVTADIPLAERGLTKGARVLDAKGRPFHDGNIGAMLATRELMEDLRRGGLAAGGPTPMTPKDRSRFLSLLDETINAVRRAYPDAK
ncbi:MAG: YaiI/YqxD family protein [Gemmataceae bacterium]